MDPEFQAEIADSGLDPELLLLKMREWSRTQGEAVSYSSRNHFVRIIFSEQYWSSVCKRIFCVCAT